MKQRTGAPQRLGQLAELAFCVSLVSVACSSEDAEATADADNSAGADNTAGSVGAERSTLGTIPPIDNFPVLEKFKITLPERNQHSNNPVNIVDLEEYIHPDFFFTGDDGEIVFRSPAGGTTIDADGQLVPTTGELNRSRSELREMLTFDAADRIVRPWLPAMNWVISSSGETQLAGAGAVDGRLEVEVSVDQMSTGSAAAPTVNSPQAWYSVVVGQINSKSCPALQELCRDGGFTLYDANPIKIYYRKHPEDELGTVYFASEPPEGSAKYTPVWGNWTSVGGETSPTVGVPLGARFSYLIELTGDNMNLEFTYDGDTQSFDIDVSAYRDTLLAFQAGSHNQCLPPDCDADSVAEVRFYHFNPEH